jgi:hypothetical protein
MKQHHSENRFFASSSCMYLKEAGHHPNDIFLSRICSLSEWLAIAWQQF